MARHRTANAVPCHRMSTERARCFVRQLRVWLRLHLTVLANEIELHAPSCNVIRGKPSRHRVRARCLSRGWRPPAARGTGSAGLARETLVLPGRSGSGKTTALKLINRLLVCQEVLERPHGHHGLVKP